MKPEYLPVNVGDFVINSHGFKYLVKEVNSDWVSLWNGVADSEFHLGREWVLKVEECPYYSFCPGDPDDLMTRKEFNEEMSFLYDFEKSNLVKKS